MKDDHKKTVKDWWEAYQVHHLGFIPSSEEFKNTKEVFYAGFLACSKSFVAIGDNYGGPGSIDKINELMKELGGFFKEANNKADDSTPRKIKHKLQLKVVKDNG